MPQDGESMLASTARILNIGGPPCCSDSCRMSGVFGQKLGRIQSIERISCSQYSRISQAVVRQVKYVYDWVKPILPRPFIIAGRVNASARKSTSGSTSLTFAMSHCQKLSVLVCGLSTRKI